MNYNDLITRIKGLNFTSWAGSKLKGSKTGTAKTRYIFLRNSGPNLHAKTLEPEA